MPATATSGSYHREGTSARRRVLAGETTLAQLRGELRDVFSTPGNVHWGTVLDVGMLAEALNLGFIIFSDAMQGANRWIYGLNTSPGDYPYWLLLYSSGDAHFQLAAATSMRGDAPASAFALAELPRALVDHYNLCNTSSPVGSAFRGGIS